MTTWTKQKFGNICDLQQGLAINRKSKHLIVEKSNLALLRITDLINHKEEQYIDNELVPKQFIADDGSLIYTRTGQVGLVFRNRRGVVHNNCFKIIPNNDINIDFLFYILKQKDLYNRVVKIASKAAQPDLTHTAFRSIGVVVPDDLSVQTRIASVLLAYDDLIENNEKQINILEEMAQRLYAEWFVNFRFPGHKKVKMIESGTEYGKIPEGWEVKRLEDVADVIFGFNFKSNKFQESGDGLRVVRIRDVLDGWTNTRTLEQTEKKYEILSGDLLIGMDGIFHMSMWYMKDCYLNQRVVRIRSKLPTYYLSEAIKKQLFRLQKTIVGATVGHLSNGDIRGFKIIQPLDQTMLPPFESITDNIINLKLRNQALSETRDLLIPQLVTGKRELK